MKKTTAIMQPYLFPYIGYFQLLSACDEFVILDDVQWIRRGWINRNRILGPSGPIDFTIPVRKGSREDKITEKRFSDEFDRKSHNLLRIIDTNYRKSPMFDQVMPLVEGSLMKQCDAVLPLLLRSLEIFCNYLEIETPRLRSSELNPDPSLLGMERILEINRILDAGRYINPIGGKELYDSARFAAHGIELRFLQARATCYPQTGSSEFVPFLSIIDVLMNNPVERAREMLDDFDLLEA